MSLSPGLWHKKVPRGLEENLVYRRELLKACAQSVQLQAEVKEVCRQDILFYINSFVWQVNPRHKNIHVGPFITWPFQERAIVLERGILWHMENQKDLLIEKSREMGITWISLLADDWLARFHPYHDFLMMSKSEKAVDSATHQSLFGKLRFIHEHLPPWLHDPVKFYDAKMAMVWPDTGSTLMGFASTAKAGVSERAFSMFIDEASQIDDMADVYYRVASTTYCRVINGTHIGIGTFFYDLSQDEHLDKIQFHWTQHPDKNNGLYRWDSQRQRPVFLKYVEETDEIMELTQGEAPDYDFPPDYPYDRTGNPVGGPRPGVRSPWYDNECLRVGNNLSEIAKDQDINPSGSVAQFYHPLVIKNLVKEYACHPFWEGDVIYSREGVVKEFVQKEGGPLRLWLHLRDGRPPYSTYGAGADVSQGTGATPSCLSIVNARTGEKVIEYVNADIDPKEFGILATALCRFFCDEQGEGATLAWEHHGPGTAFGKMVWQTLGYRNLYYAKDILGGGVSASPGWSPSKKGAVVVLHTDYRLALQERRFLNRSARALDETLNFKHTANGSVEHTQYQATRPEAGRENHGDIVIADALACKVANLSEKKALSETKSGVPLDHRSFLGRRLMRERAEAEAW